VDANKKLQTIKSGTFRICWIILVDPAKENWNCVFSDLITLCERLEELDIEDMREEVAYPSSFN
jgi:hypothetical protein